MKTNPHSEDPLGEADNLNTQANKAQVETMGKLGQTHSEPSGGGTELKRGDRLSCQNKAGNDEQKCTSL